MTPGETRGGNRRGPGGLSPPATPEASASAPEGRAAPRERLSPPTWGCRSAPGGLLVAIFLIAIWLPRIQMTFHPFPTAGTFERRKAEPAPRLKLRTASGFPSKYGQYFNDNFGLRDLLVRWDTRLRFKLLRSSSASRLIIGRGGWIFYDSEKVGDGITIRDFRGLAAYSPQELARLHANLQRQTQWCRARGIACLFVVVPNKETIYPEYLPRSIRRIGPTTRLDQIVEVARADTAIHLLDLRGPLLRAKSECREPIYVRGGTHWNQCGAFYGYRSIMAELSRTFPQVRPFRIEDFDVAVDHQSSFDHWLGLQENTTCRLTLRQGCPAPQESRMIGKVVVVHDSFWGLLGPLIALHVRELIPQELEDRSQASLERERPDLVIYEVAERYEDRVFRQPGFQARL
jgi:hypothetical protein